ncbi:hypothetical protein EDB81DRAFT_813998 [Dactylonectria macrodidyma]|uniref:Major facilitator superfamily (MFS) profile domain-containing protein n=1 Tax=Dactylonectria macrodidyma TaxID=307937 RepID=A0A9P9DMY7_9HYPO|nr:hypothetical protein EDB81DRAFT_813998 [Dactylonectria macrodidyma]
MSLTLGSKRQAGNNRRVHPVPAHQQPLAGHIRRKTLLLICVALMGLGHLMCGFAWSAEQLLAIRSVAGIGEGGSHILIMNIVSDIATLQNRGKYQGILGATMPLPMA